MKKYKQNNSMLRGWDKRKWAQLQKKIKGMQKVENVCRH